MVASDKHIHHSIPARKETEAIEMVCSALDEGAVTYTTCKNW